MIRQASWSLTVITLKWTALHIHTPRVPIIQCTAMSFQTTRITARTELPAKELHSLSRLILIILTPKIRFQFTRFHRKVLRKEAIHSVMLTLLIPPVRKIGIMIKMMVQPSNIMKQPIWFTTRLQQASCTEKSFTKNIM